MAPCSAMICQQVTLSGDAEWPKVADAVIEAEEKLGNTIYYTAVYPDKAVAPACIECHNNHKDTPRTDFKLGDVMGGVVIRIPVR